MAEYKTLGGLDLDIGGFTESITSRSKKTLEEVSRKNRGIGAKPETEEIELDDNFLKGIAQLFRDNGYEPTQPSEDVTTTLKDEVLDEYSELMKSEIIQDVMKEVSTLGESPNKLEDIYTSMDTDFVTLENQPTVDSEGELLEIEQTEPLGLMSKVSPVVTSDKPVMAETPSQPDLKADVDSEILSPTFLNAIGITGNLTEKGVQTEVKKILKEQGMSDEEISNLVNKSLAAAEVQPTDGKDFEFNKKLIDDLRILEGLDGDTLTGIPTYSYGITEQKANEYGLKPSQFSTMEGFALAFADKYVKEKKAANKEIFSTVDEKHHLALMSYLWNTGAFGPRQKAALKQNDMQEFISEMKDAIHTQGYSSSGLSKRRAEEANMIGENLDNWTPIYKVVVSGTRAEPTFEWQTKSGEVIKTYTSDRSLHPGNIIDKPNQKDTLDQEIIL